GYLVPGRPLPPRLLSVFRSAADDRLGESDLASVTGRRVLAWLPALTATAAIVGVLLATGTALSDIVRYGWYVGYGLTLPGTLVYRALRSRVHSLVDDLAFGTAVGFVLEIAAWSAYSVLGLQRLLW